MKFDHQRAVSLHAVESYLLDELSSPLREEFEEHFFDCPECAEALRAGLILQQNGRALLRAEPQLAVAAGISGNHAGGRSGRKVVWWRAWLRIPSLVAMVATAFLVVVLWNRGVDRRSDGGADAAGAPAVSGKAVHLTGQARSSSALPVVIHSGILQPITLDVKFDGSYLWLVRPRSRDGIAFQGTGVAHRGELTFNLDTRKLEPGAFEISLKSAGDPAADEKLFQFTLQPPE